MFYYSRLHSWESVSFFWVYIWIRLVTSITVRPCSNKFESCMNIHSEMFISILFAVGNVCQDRQIFRNEWIHFQYKIQTILNKKHVFEQTIEKNVQVITECDEQSLYFLDNECTFTRWTKLKHTIQRDVWGFLFPSFKSRHFSVVFAIFVKLDLYR